MKYRVWDTDLGKLFGVFDSLDEADAFVRTLADTYGPDLDDIAMTCEDDAGNCGEGLSGAELLNRAHRAAAEREAVDERSGEVIAFPGADTRVLPRRWPPVRRRICQAIVSSEPAKPPGEIDLGAGSRVRARS